MPILSGHLLPGAELLHGSDSGFFETYRGIVETETGKVRAYVKLLHPKALANELVCTVIGQAAGLPIPGGYLVEVTLDDYPESSFLSTQKLKSTIAYGSADLNTPSLARRMGKDDEVAFKSLLNTWERWEEALLFDEWVANGDRHSGNLLVKGQNDVWLIDHTHAFNGPNWHFNDLKPGGYTRNLIAQHVERTMTLPKRRCLLDNLEKLTAEYEYLLVADLVDESHAAHFLSEGDVAAVRTFLSQRIQSLTVLVSKHVGIPKFAAMAGI